MPLTTSQNDVVFVGHGAYRGGDAPFALPAGVELCLMQPVGSTMDARVAEALVGHRVIDRLILAYDDGSFENFATLGMPQWYRHPQQAPDLLLYDLGGLRAQIEAAMAPGPHHVVLVDAETRLSALFQRADIQQLIAAHVAAQQPLRVFWAACTHQDTDPDGSVCVYHNAAAVALAATRHALQRGTHAAADAAHAALARARQNADDTAGAIAAAALHDAATANAATPF